ncbi:adenylate/guanylate cyclase domain-containing protein [Archangium sp. Cb G35]|uniref:AAA family ATPase n=1 Tax=Archangium sp. Cb G35 TaxID=1920190 RepID=UPI001300E4E3|nr:adenylate/guanylate cyclase domain-containing protein [Archangium sp. Cb G35]
MSPARAERRQLTVLFCDLVGSTVLSGLLDPEDLRELVRTYQQRCAEVIHRFDGHVAQFLGDGLLIYFGFPTAHEDDARRAVAAGLSILETMRLPIHGRQLQVRLGIHTGLVVVGEMGGLGHRENLALGETPNIAARVQGEATPDALVISEATQRLTQGFFNVEALGTRTLKGVAQPTPLYRVLAESGAVSRMDLPHAVALTPFMGRDAELKVIQRGFADAEQGHSRLVMLCGEPGIGKSRLLEVVKQQENVRSFEIFECQCSPMHSNSALYPLIEMLKRRLGWPGAANAEERLQRLEDEMGRTAPHPPDTIPLLASLLGLSYEHRYPRLELPPPEQRIRTLETLQAWWLKASELRPVLLILEDLHWADATTLELVRRLVEREMPVRMMGLLTFRPEFSLPWPSTAHMTELPLQPLPSSETECMVAYVAGRKRLPEEVQAQIVARAGGIPLFVEELTKAVLGTGLLEEKEQHYELKGPLPAGLLPTTVQDSLMARLDRLDTARPVAQLAATLGREFPYEVLQAVSNMDDASLRRELAWLIDAGLLVKQGVPPRVRYVFKHALIRDTAYESLLRKTRQQYHQQIMEALRTRFPEIAEAEPNVMAVHCEGAGLTWEAIRHWQRAAEQALSRAAFQEAVAHFEQALGLLKSLPDTLERAQKELPLQLSLGGALNCLRSWAHPSVNTTYERALQLAHQVDNFDRIAAIISGRWNFFVVLGEHAKAMESMQSLRALAEKTRDPFTHAVADGTAVAAHFLNGNHAQALEVALRSEKYVDLECDQLCIQEIGTSVFATLFGYSLLSAWHQGKLSLAQSRLKMVLEHHQKLDHAMTDCLSLWYGCYLGFCLRQPAQVQVHAEAMRRAAEKAKFPYWVSVSAIYLSWARSQQGPDVERALEQLLESFSVFQGFAPSSCTMGHFFNLVAHGLTTAGRLDQALRMAESGVRHGETAQWNFALPELWRQKGELVLMLADPSRTQEAEECLHRALQLARAHGAPMLELRASRSMSFMWKAQGKHREALELLEPACRALPDDSDALDLQEARALLAELRAAAGETALRSFRG